MNRVRTSRLLRLALVVSAAITFSSVAAAEDSRPSGSASPTSAEETASLSTPTQLVTPSAALPALTARVSVGAEVQSPSGAFGVARPLGSAELGLGARITIGAGTQWVGGDVHPASNGLAPYAQVRMQLFGNSHDGWSGGVGLTYKQTGFGGSERETEASFSATYRSPRWELGGQGVFGQSLRDVGEHDIEGKVYAAYRVVPTLSLGAAGQVRGAVGETDANAPARRVDLVIGGLASLYVGQFQFGTILGTSSVGLTSGFGAYGQGFVSVRF